MLRTRTCGELRSKDDGKKVSLCGWVHFRRDLGGLIFIHLRDRTGRVQVVIEPDKKDAAKVAGRLHYEDVVKVLGVVKKRPKGQELKNIETGDIEVSVERIEVLSPAREELPFLVEENPKASEELRLKYRYLDLRRPALQSAIELRSKVAHAVRGYLEKEKFLEIETPCLVRSTPEGARDYLVPSRVSRGHFFALPQSPQLFKQLLMISGMDRYYQIARCFRDEDLRADRQPEFTQIDIEASFVDRDDIIAWTEGVIKAAFAAAGEKIKAPFERMTYEDAMARFGSDRPDLRIPFELKDVTSCFKNSAFKPFAEAQKDGAIVAINPKGVELSRKRLDEISEFAKQMGGQIAWVKVKQDGWQAAIAKHIDLKDQKSAEKILNAKDGDTLMFAAGKKRSAQNIMGAVRVEVGRSIAKDGRKFLWVVDFPLLEWSEEEKRYMALHHPFTSPMKEDIDKLQSHPEQVRSLAYDVVLNGVELGGGSIRIHNPELQKKVFTALGISQEEASAKFGFLLEALSMGAPPHGGIALGFDRLIMVIANMTSIRDVIAFPKTTSSSCLLSDAPSTVSEDQLKELGLKLI